MYIYLEKQPEWRSSYVLDGWRMVEGTRGSYLSESFQAGSGSPPSLLFIGYRGSSPGVKWNGREAGPQSASSAEVKLCFHSLICHRGMHRDLALTYLEEINTKASGMCKMWKNILDRTCMSLVVSPSRDTHGSGGFCDCELNHVFGELHACGCMQSCFSV